jgi:hypothetical protein
MVHDDMQDKYRANRSYRALANSHQELNCVRSAMILPTVTGFNQVKRITSDPDFSDSRVALARDSLILLGWLRKKV